MQNDKPSSDIHSMGDPLSEMPWSADFVMQALEVLQVFMRDGRLSSMRPGHADSFVVGWPAGKKPEEVAEGAMTLLGMDPLVLHSTSWRHADKEVMLTYIAAVPPNSDPPPTWQVVEVGHAELARGDATAPPTSIDIMQVQEHALRHLAWLLQDDPVIADILADWSDALSDYIPEPFRALGGPAGM
jgi:hypothetical protein